MSKTVLRQFYVENMNNPTQAPNIQSNIEVLSEHVTVNTNDNLATRNVSGPNEGASTSQQHNDCQLGLQLEAPRSDMCTNRACPPSTGNSQPNMADVLSIMQGMQQQMLLMQQSMMKHTTGTTEPDHGTLRSAYAVIEQSNHSSSLPQTGESQSFITRHTGPNGIPPDLMPHLDIVSPSLRKHILEGKDVNLSTLLIPGYELSLPQNSCPHSHIKVDKRLTERLTISEFILAFGKYRRIVTDVFKQRQLELDMYESLIIRINTCYGEQAFNDYHKLFSAKAAEALRVNNTKLNWGLTDSAIYAMVTAGCKPKSCELCNSITHATQQCDKVNGSTHTATSINKGSKNKNNKQERFYHEGVEICRHFQTEKGCSWTSCRYKHVCVTCKSTTHGIHECRKTKKAGNSVQ
ncbi:uncharacterized protein LOC117343634 [Pecten maximus]|uniref:uncharacterized protein LOC117343634 n=1 Tax=Pecten maximus TaxID=6579 RepID=UPI001458B520|nr:uncharacterized protein LOC117343634 [Pecten maximus]